MNIYTRRPAQPAVKLKQYSGQAKSAPRSAFRDRGSSSARLAAREFYMSAPQDSQPGDFDWPAQMTIRGPNDLENLRHLRDWLEFRNMRDGNVRYAKIVTRFEDADFPF